MIGQLDMTMSDPQFVHVTDLLRARLGIHIPAEKRPMLVSRLQHLVRRAGCDSFGQYFDRHLARLDRGTLSRLADGLSTNHTFFWRESPHFDAFRTIVLPEARARHEDDKDVRVWCAAASTGQEPYTLVMLMRELWGPAYGGWQLGVLATDISDRALTIARAGEYDAEDAERLPAVLRTKYTVGASDGRRRIREDIREQVTYRRFNLVADRWPFRRGFDCVFLRNVLIYFDVPTKRRLLQRLAAHVVPEGVVFVGMSETLRHLAPDTRATSSRNEPAFEMVQPGMYRRLALR